MGDDENDNRTRAVHDEPVGTMGRRRFVDTLLSFGFGALSATLLTAEDVRAAGRDEVPVVYGLARSDDGEFRPRRKTVPADWYDDFRSAVAAHRTLELVHREDVASSAVVPGEYGGANAAIHVEVTTEAAHGEVPERVKDTPVEVRTVDPPTERRAGTDTPGGAGSLAEVDSAIETAASTEADPSAEGDGAASFAGTATGDAAAEQGQGIPGSVAVASDKLYGTLAPAMTDPTDGSLYFATANHVFGGTDNGGKPLYRLDDGRTEIGAVRDSYPKADVVCADPASGYRPLHRIRDGDPGRVLGQFTKVGLADLKAAGEPLEKIGVKTGHTTGKIQAVDGLTCAYGAICKHGQLKWGRESDFDDGDSGSVSYHADPDDPTAGVLVGGFNNARTWWPGENYIWGTAAYHVTERYGFTF